LADAKQSPDGAARPPSTPGEVPSPNCGGGGFNIISTILERQVIEKILTHLALDPQPPPKGRAREAGHDFAACAAPAAPERQAPQHGLRCLAAARVSLRRMSARRRKTQGQPRAEGRTSPKRTVVCRRNRDITAAIGL